MHELLRQLYSSKVYKRTFFSVIALLLIVTLVVSFFFYDTFLGKQRADIERQARESLAQMESQMNGHLQELFRIVMSIDENGTFLYAPLSAKAQREALQAELTRYVSDNSFLTDMSYESLLDESTIYSSQGIFTKEIFSKYIYQTTAAFDAEAFSKRKRALTLSTIAAPELNAVRYPIHVMAFVYGLPIMSSNQRRFISFYVEKSKLDQLVRSFLPSFSVEDIRIYEQTALIYSLNGLKDEGDALRLTHKSSTTAYTYELVAKDAQMYASYYKNLSFFITLLAVTLLVILLSGGMVALYNYNPLYRLVKKFAGEHPQNQKQDEMAVLNELVEEAIAQKHTMARRLFISNLVWEQYEDLDTLQNAAQESGISFLYPCYTCCAVEFSEGEDSAQLQQHIENALDLQDALAVCAKRHGQNRLTVVVNHAQEEATLKAILTRLESFQNVTMGVSQPGMDVLHLSAQNTQARHALHYALENHQPLTRFLDMPAVCAPAAPVKEQRAQEDALHARILACMMDNLKDNSLSLEWIAGQCGVSASYLVRHFKAITGVTPMQYVDTKRMEIAKQLLTTTGYPLRQIVEQCGYLDESNFARKFKKQEGMTPMNYRKENWQA